MIDPFQVDIFGIGVPKSASTWFATCLGEHPEVCMSEPKETDYFCPRLRIFPETSNPRFNADLEAYRRHFAHARPGQLLADFSINMLRGVPEAPLAVKAHNPKARFIVTLRDPAARTYSHYWHREGLSIDGDVPASFEEAMHSEELLQVSRYAKQLRAWMKVFPRDRFHVILDLDIKADSGAVLRDAFAFLGIDPAFDPPSRARRVNRAKAYRGIQARAWKVTAGMRRMGMGPVVSLGRRLGAERLLHKVDIKHRDYPPLEPRLRAELVEVYRKDIKDLERLLERDLEPWRQV